MQEIASQSLRKSHTLDSSHTFSAQKLPTSPPPPPELSSWLHYNTESLEIVITDVCAKQIYFLWHKLMNTV